MCTFYNLHNENKIETRIENNCIFVAISSTVAGKGHLDMSIFYLYPEFSSGLINTRSRVLTQDREF